KTISTEFTVSGKVSPDINVTVDPENATVTVELPENATGNVTVVIDGKVYNITNVTGGTTVINIGNLTPGNHTVEVIYSGDGNYTGATDVTDVNIPKIDDYVFDVNATGGLNSVTVDVVLPDDVNGVVLVDINGTGYYVNVTGGKGSVTIDNLPEGSYVAVVTYPGDERYDNKTISTEFTVDGKVTPDINITVNPEDSTVTVELPENATGNVTVVIDGKVYNITNVTGGINVINIGNLTPGNHTVEVIYSGDDNYNPASDAADVTVPKLKNFINVDATVVNNTATIDIELPEQVNGVVLIDVNGTGYYVNATNGKATLELTDLANGDYSVVARYSDDVWEYAENSTSFTVDYDAITTPISIVSQDITIGEDLNVTVIVPGDAKGNVTINIDGKTLTTKVSNGIAEFIIPGLSAGDYSVIARYDGDDKYGENSTTAFVKVMKIINYPTYITNEVKNLTVHLPEDAKGNITLIVDGETFTGDIVNGTVTVYDPNLTPGYHNATVICSGDDKYAYKVTEMLIYIENIAIIYAPNVTKYYSGPERLYIYLHDLEDTPIADASLTVTINGVKYSRTTDKNGMASLALNLNSENYTVLIEFNGNEEFDPTSALSGVSVLPTIYANDVVKVFRNGTQYYALFLDGQGNPLVNTEVSFNIHGVFYTRTTNDKGVARLNLNLEKGTYILTAINPVTGEMRTNTVEVISQIVENHDLTKYYRNGSQYTVRILADDGNPAGEGELVTFNIHGVIYSRYTNAEGYATLNINLNPGTYIITTYYKECREGNHIVVLPIIFGNNTFETANEDFVFTAHLLDGQGNPFPGQTIEFNIDNEKFMTGVTDSNGDARVTLNLQSGNHLIKSTYQTASVVNTIVAQ
ncbi:Ig-like domain repeat protein, partial [Methanobrevibacter millerae]